MTAVLDPPKQQTASIKIVLVAVLTGVMTALVLLHVHGVNGPWYWTWSWRRLSFWLYPAMAAAAIPFIAAQVLDARWGRRRLALGLLALSVLSLELTALSFQPPTGLRRLPLIVKNTVNTSYYTDAAILHDQRNIATRDWLYQYPQIVPLLHVHARFKPPGLLLFYIALIELFGKGMLAATAGGIVVAFSAAAAVPLTYRLIVLYGQDADAAFCGASYLALCPSLLLFLPQFDQLYAAMSAALLILFGLTMKRRGWWWAAFGAAMALALFLSYIFLILGLFFLAYWLIDVTDRGPSPAIGAAWRLASATMLCASLYGGLWFFTGFNPIRTYHVVERIQVADLVHLGRPFPLHIPFDLLDMALGSGWISFLLIFFLIASWGHQIFVGRERGHRLVQLALLEILTVDLAALLPGETARLWLPMFPLLMAPIGFELVRWRVRERATVYACLWLMLVLICQNMVFIYMGPELDGPRWGH